MTKHPCSKRFFATVLFALITNCISANRNSEPPAFSVVVEGTVYSFERAYQAFCSGIVKRAFSDKNVPLLSMIFENGTVSNVFLELLSEEDDRELREQILVVMLSASSARWYDSADESNNGFLIRHPALGLHVAMADMVRQRLGEEILRRYPLHSRENRLRVARSIEEAAGVHLPALPKERLLPDATPEQFANSYKQEGTSPGSLAAKDDTLASPRGWIFWAGIVALLAAVAGWLLRWKARDRRR